MKIHYENACSFKKADFEFLPGKLYLIKGGNNSGKSAAFYVLSSALLNSKEAKSYINNDALKENSNARLKVTIEDDNNNIVSFERGTGSSKYVVNGDHFSKLGRENIFTIYPEILTDFLYDANESNKIINIQGEDNTLFPFNRSEAEQFKLFEKIFNIASTSAIFKSINLDEDETKNEINNLILKINSLESEQYKINEVLSSVNVEELNKAYTQFSSNFSWLQQAFNDINNCRSIQTYMSAVSCLESADINMSDIGFLKQLYIDLTEYQQLDVFVNKISELEYFKFSEEFEITRITDLIKDYELYINSVKEKDTINSEISIFESGTKKLKTELKSVEICPLCGNHLKGEDLCRQ